jgi:hypothetical protein
VTLVIAIRRRFERLLANSSAASELPGAVRMRRGLALMFAVYAVALSIAALQRGDMIKGGYVMILMGAVALYTNRGGRFLKDWFPVILGLFAYSLAGSFAEKLKFGIHYLPQIDIDNALFGGLPTVWLQQHLYHGTTGALEVATSVAYLSHFFGPVFLGFYLWWTNRRSAFTTLMFSLLAVCLLAETTFVLAPTAPPWMAAEQGLIPPVHDLFKQTLLNLHFTKAASFIGNSKNYNTVAAMPSLHAAWPVVAFLVARRYRLSRWIRGAIAVQWLAIINSIVSTGEHYVSDALVGAVYGLLAYLLVARVLGRVRDTQGQGVTAALAERAHDGIAARLPADAGLAQPASVFESVEG